ncbi:subtilisin-like serine protease 2 [Perilla frutescens var. hirtella]|uniref:Subtilisin-like serine protease 2 n=1 Tax=Perilla frutescens var. hirtella TaxID=608512 RepID=A0AAD4JH59_PERFH|nr:subtilisin-like serine protease 2 [Perilla frutescens var. hirtella]
MGSQSLHLQLFLLLLLVAQLSADQTARTYIVRVDSSSKPSVFPTHFHWYTAEFTEPATILHVYDTVFHGFSAVLTPFQASSVLKHPSILAAFEDRRRELHTTRSPQFLGLRNQRGLWSESDYGSDVIIGVFDTGIWPERRSFSDLNLGPVPKRWRGTCQTGVRFSARNCNRKIVGARYFDKGHQAASGFGGIIGGINETIEFRSPRDADGHGTHTASTAAGRYAFKASMEGYAAGIAKGVAPKARLAVYKVCWKNAGCFDSDILAAFDSAVNDGVDVISISIGGGEGISSPYYLDPIAIGAYGAVSRGIFVSSSAGNDGPNGMSVTNLAPWLTTVGAGTIDRDFPADVILSNGRKFPGVSLYSGEPLNGKMHPLIYPGKTGVLSASLCMENSLDPNEVRGKIVICDRGSSPRVAKGLVVKKAGGVGMILANGVSNGEGLVGDAHLIPACAVGSAEGDEIKSYLASNPAATATINFRGTVIGIKPAPVVASFSARGPNGLNPEILKPDLIAPGVNILAAWTDAVGPTGLDSDTRRSEFNILSGTSMACPHVSGAAALLKSAHPDWSPAAIRSAIMTTASLTDNSFDPMMDESSKKRATPYDFGAGHLNLDLAMDPGMVYDLSNNDYVNFLCAIEYGPKTIQVITRSPVNCPMKKPMPENLNYPSIAALFPSGESGVSSKTFFRMVTNVGEANAVYRVKVEQPKGVMVSVKPGKLVFSEKLRKQGYYVTITIDSKNLVLDDSGAVYGALSWMDGKHVVRSPIVVTQMEPL